MKTIIEMDEDDIRTAIGTYIQNTFGAKVAEVIINVNEKRDERTNSLYGHTINARVRTDD